MCLVLVFGERSDRLYLYLYFYVRESLIEIHFREQLFFLPSLICITVQETVLTSWILLHIYRKKPNGEIPLLTQRCTLMLKMESNHSGTLFWHFYCVLSVRLGRRVESHSTVDAWWWSMKAILEIIMHFDECKFWWM